jgi:hypothetical protein
MGIPSGIFFGEPATWANSIMFGRKNAMMNPTIPRK